MKDESVLHWERGVHDGIIWVRHRKDGAYGKILSMANGTVQLAIQTDHISARDGWKGGR